MQPGHWPGLPRLASPCLQLPMANTLRCRRPPAYIHDTSFMLKRHLFVLHHLTVTTMSKAVRSPCMASSMASDTAHYRCDLAKGSAAREATMPTAQSFPPLLLPIACFFQLMMPSLVRNWQLKVPTTWPSLVCELFGPTLLIKLRHSLNSVLASEWGEPVHSPESWDAAFGLSLLSSLGSDIFALWLCHWTTCRAAAAMPPTPYTTCSFSAHPQFHVPHPHGEAQSKVFGPN